MSRERRIGQPHALLHGGRDLRRVRLLQCGEGGGEVHSLQHGYLQRETQHERFWRYGNLSNWEVVGTVIGRSLKDPGLVNVQVISSSKNFTTFAESMMSMIQQPGCYKQARTLLLDPCSQFRWLDSELLKSPKSPTGDVGATFLLGHSAPGLTDTRPWIEKTRAIPSLADKTAQSRQ